MRPSRNAVIIVSAAVVVVALLYWLWPRKTVYARAQDLAVVLANAYWQAIPGFSSETMLSSVELRMEQLPAFTQAPA